MRITEILTREKGASGSRPKHVAVDTIVVHTTDTAGLRRFSVDRDWNLKRIRRALEAKGIDQETADRLRSAYKDGAVMSDGVIMALIAASTPREACAHYYVSSMVDYEIARFVPEARQAHHIGPIGGSTNKRSIGIEVLYYGALPASMPSEDAKRTYSQANWPDPVRLPGPDGKVRWYSPVNPDCVLEVANLCVDIAMRWPIKAICSHYLFAPTKRIDPDPPVNLEFIRDHVSRKIGRLISDKPPRQR